MGTWQPTSSWEAEPLYDGDDGRLAWAQLEALGVRMRHRPVVLAAGGPQRLLALPRHALVEWLAANLGRRGRPLSETEVQERIARTRRVVRPFLNAGGRALGGDRLEEQRRLASAADPRQVLFAYGPTKLLDAPMSIAIVGTRKATEKAMARAHDLARELAELGGVVVSGGADGIDRAAHRGALMAGGRSIEVVGERLEPKSPSRHGRLPLVDNRLLKLVMHGPCEPPGAWLYARRNRFIAAAADALVVVQGEERSGARYAAEAALALGRPVRVFPGDIDDPRAGLANKLLAETDARPFRRLDELLEAAGGPAHRRSVWAMPITGEQVVLPFGDDAATGEALPPLLEALREAPRTVDELAVVLGCTPHKAQQEAFEWEMQGKVVRAGGRLRLAHR